MWAGTEHQRILSRLQAACVSQDADEVEFALRRAYESGLFPGLVPVLIELCRAPWHTCHEDVVSALQQVGDITAVSALEDVVYASHSYLDYDENFALARKATWALADIGGADARKALGRIASLDNEIKAAHAKKRLQQWDGELRRKRNQA